MPKKDLKNLIMLLASTIIGIVLVWGYTHGKTSASEKETQTQIIKQIHPKEAFNLIRNNKTNPDFVILDVRTPQEFREESIEGAVDLDFHSETFREELDKLDKNKTYLIHCRSGRRSGKTLDMMKELKFKEVYHLLGGISAWKTEGLPTKNSVP